MDTRLKSVRHGYGWSQMRLVVEVEQACEREGLPCPSRASLKVMVSRWENGHVTPDATHAALLAAIYRTTPADLDLEPAAPTLWLPATTGNGTPSREYLATMEALLGEYARADNTVGPGHLIGVVGQHLAHLDSLLSSADHDLLSPALRLSSQYAEFAGWLSQDAGDLAEAERWTDRALDFLVAEDDPAARSYVMMRKAGIAAERRDVVRSAGLADAATRELDRLDPSMRSLVLRQQAISHALSADERVSDQAAAAALEASAEYGPDVVKSYATPSYVLMETGVAAMRLKRLELAVDRLSQALREWP
jgi:transcriptional regulator with XRE-family HTH domain